MLIEFRVGIKTGGKLELHNSLNVDSDNRMSGFRCYEGNCSTTALVTLCISIWASGVG